MPVNPTEFIETLQCSSKPTFCRLLTNHKFASVRLSPIVSKPKKIEVNKLTLHLILSPIAEAKINSASLVRMQLQPISTEPLRQNTLHTIAIIIVLKHHHKVSQPREPPPWLLSEPSVSLSTHWAPIIQPLNGFVVFKYSSHFRG